MTLLGPPRSQLCLLFAGIASIASAACGTSPAETKNAATAGSDSASTNGNGNGGTGDADTGEADTGNADTGNNNDTGDTGESTGGEPEPDCAAIEPARCWYIATDGDDAGAGTIDDPYLSFHTAIEQAGPGDYIYAREGTYGRANAVLASLQRLPQANFPPPCAPDLVEADGYCQAPKLMFASLREWNGYPDPDDPGYTVAAGEPGNPITLRNFPGELPVLDVNDLLLSEEIETTMTGRQRQAIQVNTSYWNIRGFEIVGGSIDMQGNITDIGVEGCDIHDLTLDGGDNPGLIRLNRGPENVRIIGNRLHAIFDVEFPGQWQGVPDSQHFGAVTTLSGETYGGEDGTGAIEIRDNEVFNVPQVFFFKNAAAGPIEVVNNRIYDSGSLTSNASANVRMAGNLIVGVRTGDWRHGLGSPENGALSPEQLAAVLAMDGHNFTVEYNTFVGLEDTMMRALYGDNARFVRNLVMGLPGTAATAGYDSASMFKLPTTGTTLQTMSSDLNCYVVADPGFRLLARYPNDGGQVQSYDLAMAQAQFGLDLQSSVVIATDPSDVFVDPADAASGDYTPLDSFACADVGHTALP